MLPPCHDFRVFLSTDTSASPRRVGLDMGKSRYQAPRVSFWEWFGELWRVLLSVSRFFGFSFLQFGACD